MTDPLDRLVATAARLYGTCPELVVGRPPRKPSRQPAAVTARAAVSWCLILHCNHTARQAARALGIHHSTVMASLTSLDPTDPRLRDLEQEALWPTSHP